MEQKTEKLFINTKSIRIEASTDRLKELESIFTNNNIYPISYRQKNRAMYVESYWLPEILYLLRGVSVDNYADLLPNSLAIQYLDNIITRRTYTNLLENGPENTPIVNDKLTLTQPQQLGRELARIFKRFGFFFDTRIGKTALSLSIINDSLKINPEEKWLIVCPLLLVEEAWVSDTNKFGFDFSISTCIGNKKTRLQNISKDANVYILNTEAYINYSDEILSKGITCIILDESSSLKSTRAKFTSKFIKDCANIDRVYLLSGTPAPNGEWEYYAQLKILNEYCIPNSYTAYTLQYFNNFSRDPKYQIFKLKPDKKDTLYNIIKRYAIYVDKEDAFELPGKTLECISVPIDKSVASYYKEMKKEMAIELSTDKYLLANSAAARTNKLLQLSSGFIINNEEDKTIDISDFKVRFLVEFLQTLPSDEQIIIWAVYRHEFDLIKQALNVIPIYGGTNAETKLETINNFKRGLSKYLLASPYSIDKGFTLTNCSIAVYFSLPWSYENFKQSMDRIYGPTYIQNKMCKYFFLLTESTINKDVYDTLINEKSFKSTNLLNYLKAGYTYEH